MLSLTLASLYFVGLLIAARIWKSIPCRNKISLPADHPGVMEVGLIVVVRNEEARLSLLLESLNDQSYLNFCLHLVDDNSTDRTLEVVEQFRASAKFKLQVYQLPAAKGSPKKRAIEMVVEQARQEYFVVTDGDCRPFPQWIEQHLALHLRLNAHFISGPVVYNPVSNGFAQLQHLEFLALIGIGGVSLASGQAGMCNAANMSFSRLAFKQVGGYQGNRQIASGDDEFLLRKIMNWNPHSAYFLKSQAARVETEAAVSWKEFYHQRKRWAGKWRHHPPAAKFKAIGLVLFYLVFLLGSVGENRLGVGLAWLIKAGGDWYFLRAVARSLRQSVRLVPFIQLLLVYPFYVLFFAVTTNWGSYTWKGRAYHPARLKT